MSKNDVCVVVPWVTDTERASFLEAWKIRHLPTWLVLQQDVAREGCGVTKNNGVRCAMELGAEIVVVLDSDCYPSSEANSLEGLMGSHVNALQPQPVQLFQAVTDPASRGTPYLQQQIVLPVAASMGFWIQVPDYCAVRQLAFNTKPMRYERTALFGRYFALCGMNMAFRPHDWLPWCQFIDVARFDDIWMGWLWQREANRRRCCFNLNGPMITHARQSNVWRNLRDEALHLEANETLWQTIALHESDNYSTLRKVLPC